MITRISTIVLLVLLGTASLASSAWKQVVRFKLPASCAFFFDASHGLVGLGSINLDKQSRTGIYLTTDAGLSWTQCAIPSDIGAITAIYMQSKTVGYASVMFGPYALLQTTDGGLTWNGIKNQDGFGSTCVYATPTAITMTSWFTTGGSSINGGQTFSQVLFSQDNSDRSNGIDFLDDRNGVVTMGPDATRWNAPDSYTYYTTDGGVTWKRGGMLYESWGVYADKQTGNYFSMAEDAANNPGNTLYWSRDGGKSWSARYGFNKLEFTGHIAGVGKTMYVQTAVSNSGNMGLYRSDDDGSTWHRVFGPSNTRDSRFFVTGCRGEVVYAFDNTGGVWLTTDGGDGTLIPAPYIGAINAVRAGQSTLIPIKYDTLTVPTIIPELAGSILLNDNLLTPDTLDFTGSQFADSVSFDTIYRSQAGVWSYDIKFKPKTKLTGSSTLPMFQIRARAYLTDTNRTTVDLGPMFIVNGAISTELMDCPTIQGSVNGAFDLVMACGDTTLYQYLRGVSVEAMFSAYPNPARDIITLSGQLPAAMNIQVTFYSEDGREVRATEFSHAAGHLEQHISTNALPAGSYLMQIRTALGGTYTLKVSIER